MKNQEVDNTDDKNNDDQFLSSEEEEKKNIEQEHISEDVDVLSEATFDEIIDERDSLKDRLMRALADLENFRKRSERDRKDAELYGGTKLARDLLSVFDNMSRALNNIDDELRSKAPALAEGLELTQRELLSVFSKHKIDQIQPLEGEKFDPKYHQAMFEAPVPGTKKGTIIQVMTNGFKIGDRLLRASQVGVSSNEGVLDKTNEKSDAENEVNIEGEESI